MQPARFFSYSQLSMDKQAWIPKARPRAHETLEHEIHGELVDFPECFFP